MMVKINPDAVLEKAQVAILELPQLVLKEEINADLLPQADL
jgi:hypothetical protein